MALALRSRPPLVVQDDGCGLCGGFTPETGHHGRRPWRLHWADCVAKVSRLDSFKFSRAVGVPTEKTRRGLPKLQLTQRAASRNRATIALISTFLITAGFVPIFVTLHFPTFATESPQRRTHRTDTGWLVWVGPHPDSCSAVNLGHENAEPVQGDLLARISTTT